MATDLDTELIGLDDLRKALDGKTLPGDELTIEGYQSALADHALLAPAEDSDHAHPFWLIVLALRGMGITVDELCALAGQREQDTLLFGTCGIEQHSPPRVGHTFRTSATVGPVARKESRGGGFLDFVTVRVEIRDAGELVGVVNQGFIFKRGA
ncbi:hypothetical protein LWC33_06680 [Pseudonocardia sp. RS11V-5]|uniref:hypothetical protein n=1 Tax=Pseudonocardia terrae TaxID=2905831 RepID=UPI001E3C686A|nr:hypothetical protein [Pseudonocardia terrae]MCE3551139.1 hypothetical protein [Pseudonocardia terrae]